MLAQIAQNGGKVRTASRGMESPPLLAFCLVGRGPEDCAAFPPMRSDIDQPEAYHQGLIHFAHGRRIQRPEPFHKPPSIHGSNLPELNG